MAHRAGGGLDLRYPLSHRDLEEMFRERGFEVDHSTVNRRVLAYAPMIEKRLRYSMSPESGLRFRGKDMLKQRTKACRVNPFSRYTL
jgi:hypothetical protein